MAKTENEKLSLTLGSFPTVLKLVQYRADLAHMIEADTWLPDEFKRALPGGFLEKLGEKKLKGDVVRMATAAIEEIDRELTRYGFEFPSQHVRR